jgi:hypothetical protein
MNSELCIGTIRVLSRGSRRSSRPFETVVSSSSSVWASACSDALSCFADRFDLPDPRLGLGARVGEVVRRRLELFERFLFEDVFVLIDRLIDVVDFAGHRGAVSFRARVGSVSARHPTPPSCRCNDAGPGRTARSLVVT